MILTSRELEICNKIENSRVLNPEGMSAKDWIEGNPRTQRELARQFHCSDSLMVILCQKLGVERNLKAGVTPAKAGVNGWGQGNLGSITAEKRLQTKLLKAARAGDEDARKRLLEEFGIRLIFPDEQALLNDLRAPYTWEPPIKRLRVEVRSSIGSNE